MRMSTDTTGATSVPQSLTDDAAQPVPGSTTGPMTGAGSGSQPVNQPVDQTADAPPPAEPPPAEHKSFWDRFAAIASTVGVNVLLFTPLAPIAPIVAAGIAEAQKIPGATGPEKLQHVAVLIQEAVMGVNTQAGRQVLDPQLVNDTYVNAVNTAVAAIKLVHSATPDASRDVARAAVDAMAAKVLPGTAEALAGQPDAPAAAAGAGSSSGKGSTSGINARQPAAAGGRTAAGFSSEPKA